MSRGGLCKHCGLEFKFLKYHIDRVHSDSNDIRKCHLCKKIFNKEKSLKDHIRKVINNYNFILIKFIAGINSRYIRSLLPVQSVLRNIQQVIICKGI